MRSEKNARQKCVPLHDVFQLSLKSMASGRGDLRADYPRERVVGHKHDSIYSYPRARSQILGYNAVRNQDRHESEECKYITTNLEARVHPGELFRRKLSNIPSKGT